MISLRVLWAVLVLFRLHNCLIASGSVVVGAFLASRSIELTSLMATLMAFFMCAGGYALNDVFDLGSDRVIKPRRPLVSGRLKRESAVKAVIIAWAIGCGFAMLAGRAALVFLLGWAILLYLYSWKLKSYGIAGPVVVSCVASSGFLLGGATSGNITATGFPFAIALFVHMARETVKSVVDAEGDRPAGIATLAVSLGEQRTLALSLWFVVGLIAVSLVPFVFRVYGYLYMLPVVIVIYPLLVICIHLIIGARHNPARSEHNSRAAAALLKAVMPVGLVAFLLAGMSV